MSKQIKRYVICIISILIVVFGILYGLSAWEKDNTQEIYIRAATDTDVGAINQTMRFELSEFIDIPLHSDYFVTVQYIIVDEVTTGDTLFKNEYRTVLTKEDKLAHFGCKQIEQQTLLNANKKNIVLELQLVATPSNIYDEDGNTFDNTKQQLIPVITVESIFN